MSWSCDWDGPKVYDESEVVARKEHRCVECSAPILRGEKHLVYRGMWEDYWGGGRQHLLCRDVCVWIRDVIQDGECIAFGELQEWMSEFSNETGHGTERLRGMFAMIRNRERIAQHAGVEA